MTGSSVVVALVKESWYDMVMVLQQVEILMVSIMAQATIYTCIANYTLNDGKWFVGRKCTSYKLWVKVINVQQHLTTRAGKHMGETAYGHAIQM